MRNGLLIYFLTAFLNIIHLIISAGRVAFIFVQFFFLSSSFFSSHHFIFSPTLFWSNDDLFEVLSVLFFLRPSLFLLSLISSHFFFSSLLLQASFFHIISYLFSHQAPSFILFPISPLTNLFLSNHFSSFLLPAFSFHQSSFTDSSLPLTAYLKPLQLIFSCYSTIFIPTLQSCSR